MSVSWLDRLVIWGSTRRVPGWVVLISAWAVSIVAVGASMAAVGCAPSDIRFQMVSTFYWVLGVGGYSYLTRCADRALRRFRPALEIADGAFDAVRRRLTSLPPRPALIASALGVVIAVLAAWWDASFLAVVEVSVPVASLVWVVNFLAGVGLPVILVFYLVRMLWQVAALHRSASTIDIFNTEPAHAFAGATSRTGGLLVLVVTYSVLTDPSTFTNPVWISFGIGSLVLAVLAFVLPLTGMRRRLKEEKRLLADEVRQRIASTVTRVNAAIDTGNHEEVKVSMGVVEALEWQRNRIQRASTWPWDTATLRGFVSTLLLPVLTWLVTTLLGRLLSS